MKKKRKYCGCIVDKSTGELKGWGTENWIPGFIESKMALGWQSDDDWILYSFVLRDNERIFLDEYCGQFEARAEYFGTVDLFIKRFRRK